jgi:hypothetical protein
VSMDRPLDVVIVGAPRSGTNMLRDVLTSLPGVATWPCDEINLVWRHGNRAEPSDELTAAQARPEVASYVRGQFDRIRRRYDAPVVVEKTCATSLRVEFTRAVVPDAKYVFITRDGIDAAASSMDRWHASFDLRYTAAKARFVPSSDLPYYGARFVANQVRRRASRSGHATGGEVTTWWGPKPHDWREIMRGHPLDEVCALQWQRCVDASRRGLAGLPDEQLHHVAYEDFVADPVARTGQIVRFLGLPAADVSDAVGRVSARSVGKGRATLGPEAVARLEALVGPTLEHGRGE